MDNSRFSRVPKEDIEKLKIAVRERVIKPMRARAKIKRQLEQQARLR